eukprot:TRINITY_DN12033_c0_g1_i1.p1 TRINITY_DN12033_c0_g1~~TRINITY_DN12033_c0_g1_i1.p1  ORF type:complete len:266 (-),score=65.48 TRINITY_DN12033_c0_g1_i1:15-779(-)
MVLLKCKRTETDLFVLDTLTTVPLDEVVKELADIWNLRLRLRWVAVCAADLIKAHPDRTAALASVIAEVDAALKQTTSVTSGALDELLLRARGAVKIAFPEECSGGDPVAELTKQIQGLEIAEDDRLRKQYIVGVIDEEPEHMADRKELIDPAKAVAWFSGRQLYRDKTIAEIVGRNEKTTLVVKLTPPDSGAPAREQPMGQHEVNHMLSYWHKKQEEAKRLEEDDDISFGNSGWADPRQLKTQFQGIGNVRIR